jgi:uncharacterized protein (DUF58 family)
MGLKSIVKPVFVVSLGFVLYLIASNVGAGWLYVVVAAILGLVLVSIPLPWLGVRRIGVARRAPVVATAGEPFECILELENNGRLPRYMIEVADRFAGGGGRAVAVRVRRGKPGVSTPAGRSSSSRGLLSGCSTDAARYGWPLTP